MALRAFHANPSIGGFGNENSASLLLLEKKSSSANDNTNEKATMAAEASQGGDALCQIVKELVDNAVDACESSRKKAIEAVEEKDIPPSRVRVEIMPYQDSGKDCEVLQITVSDNGCGMTDIHNCVNAFQSTKSGDGMAAGSQEKTAGRYGLGLTLSMVHSQRLCPFKVVCCITSATKEASFFCRQRYFVNTSKDVMECDREETVPKTNADDSGTCVSVLVPGGETARQAWDRLVVYLKRFHLSPIQCSIEILAPTLESLPIVVKSRSGSHESASLSREESASLSLTEGFDSDEDGDHKPNAALAKIKKAFLPERTTLLQSAQKYGFFRLPLKQSNVAHSEQVIRLPGHVVPSPSESTPKILVNIIISPFEDLKSVENYGGDSMACMELVRMVNSVPLLDGAESMACGFVQAIKLSTSWSAFGLTVLGGGGSSEGKTNEAWVTRFQVRDSDQVAPFFRQNTHDLWEDQEERKPDNDQGNEAKRTGRKRIVHEIRLPAKVRLAKILLIVNIQAAPNMLPMPSLAKGRLPINHEPINQALHLGIRECLKNLQTTSPNLLLSASQLRSVERDVRYIPLLANASANLLGRMQSRHLRNRAISLVQQIRGDHDDAGAKYDPSPPQHDDVFQILEQQCRKSVHDAEATKKQSKRSKTTGNHKNKNNALEENEYTEIEECSAFSLKVKSTRNNFSIEPTQPRGLEYQSLSDKSSTSGPKSFVSSSSPPKEVNLMVGGANNLDCEGADEDEDDEWW